MKGWNEVRTVLTVMKYGTLSGAAKQLGVHRATVLRHVDTLESELKTKLFVRHANGYLPTDTGRELERIAKVTEDQFDLFSKRIRYNNSELEGDFVITSLDILCPLLMPAIRTFQEKHPKVMVNFQSSEDIFKL
ncbi:LysR family transcriptional regulator, partial [Alteromonas sp.]|nr:LysR family transcriptional regulator [Alteromonas sp.]